MTYYIDTTKENFIKFHILDRAFTSGYDINKMRFKKAIDWILDPVNEPVIQKFVQNEILFDYSDYWGLPLQIANHLTGDEVDLIQEFQEDLINYFNDEDAFDLKKPKKTLNNLIKMNLHQEDINDIGCKTMKFMFKNYWDINNVYESGKLKNSNKPKAKKTV